MTIEVCAQSYDIALLARQYGANRIELCSALSVGGLTPSYGLIRQCTKLDGLEVHVMIRHKGGHFVLSDTDISIMLKDIEMAAQSGVNGVVFGCLTTSNDLDLPRLNALVTASKSFNLEVTFHRAFDFIKNPFEALDELIALKVDRILTSGQKPTAIQGIKRIEEYVKYSAGRIQIMAGSGINANNALTLVNSGIDAIHFTAHQKDGKEEEFEMGASTKPDVQKMEAIKNLFI